MTPNTNDVSSQGLRSYRCTAVSYLKSRELNRIPPEACELFTDTSSWSSSGSSTSTLSSPACCVVSPSPRSTSPSPSSRSRSRAVSPEPSSSPSSPSSSPPPSSSREASKVHRAVSPNGTPWSSAPVALRHHRPGGREEQASSSDERRVHWAESLISSVITRPRTLRKDVPELYYSRADEKRFRKEAEKPPPSLTTTLSTQPFSDEPLWSTNPGGKRKDYGISKAVVVFGDSTLTYGTTSESVVGGGGCTIEAAQVLEAKSSLDGGGFSFDDAAFWNGRLTWS